MPSERVQEAVLCTAWTTRTPAFWGYPPPPHDYPYYWVILDPKSKEDKVKVTNLKNMPKLHIFKFWSKLYTRHTFWSSLIRCANMKWIQRVLLKIQSGHDSVHRQTDGRTRWNQYTPLQLHWNGGYNNFAKKKCCLLVDDNLHRQQMKDPWNFTLKKNWLKSSSEFWTSDATRDMYP